jgi:hypothetical protein
MKYFLIKSNVQYPHLHKRTDNWGLVIELGIGKMDEVDFGNDPYLYELKKMTKIQDKHFEQIFEISIEGAREFWKIANKLSMGDDALVVIQDTIDITLKKPPEPKPMYKIN